MALSNRFALLDLDANGQIEDQSEDFQKPKKSRRKDKSSTNSPPTPRKELEWKIQGPYFPPNRDRSVFLREESLTGLSFDLATGFNNETDVTRATRHTSLLWGLPDPNSAHLNELNIDSDVLQAAGVVYASQQLVKHGRKRAVSDGQFNRLRSFLYERTNGKVESSPEMAYVREHFTGEGYGQKIVSTYQWKHVLTLLRDRLGVDPLDSCQLFARRFVLVDIMEKPFASTNPYVGNYLIEFNRERDYIAFIPSPTPISFDKEAPVGSISFDNKRLGHGFEAVASEGEESPQGIAVLSLDFDSPPDDPSQPPSIYNIAYMVDPDCFDRKDLEPIELKCTAAYRSRDFIPPIQWYCQARLGVVKKVVLGWAKGTKYAFEIVSSKDYSLSQLLDGARKSESRWNPDKGLNSLKTFVIALKQSIDSDTKPSGLYQLRVTGRRSSGKAVWEINHLIPTEIPGRPSLHQLFQDNVPLTS